MSESVQVPEKRQVKSIIYLIIRIIFLPRENKNKKLRVCCGVKSSVCAVDVIGAFDSVHYSLSLSVSEEF